GGHHSGSHAHSDPAPYTKHGRPQPQEPTGAIRVSTRPPSRRDADVVTGVRGADRTLIRLMKPSDDRGLIAAMAGQAIADRPLRPNHPLLTEELSAALVAGSNGTWDTWLQQQQARGADIDEVCWAYAAVLVAERHGAIVGVATLHP